MHTPKEGYVLHTYGPERFVHHAAASVMTLRRHDAHRPVALFCPDTHREHLRKHGKADLFEDIRVLPEEHASITGFKHHLHRFMPYERTLFVDADIIWCRNPDPVWKQFTGISLHCNRQRARRFLLRGTQGLANRDRCDP